MRVLSALVPKLRLETRKMRSSSRNLATLLLVGVPLALSVGGRADEFDRANLHEFLAQRIASYSLTGAADDAKRFVCTETPVLRYSDPTRSFVVEGAMSLWLDGERPVAAGTIWVDSDKNSRREFAALADSPLVCHDERGAIIWQPEGGEVADRPMHGVPEPAESKALRLAQMRSIVRRFAATCYRGPDRTPYELRLMPQPVYRHSSVDEGILDAAVFAFASANDPEMLVIVTAQPESESQPASWTYSLARMCSMKILVRLDGAEVHTFRNYWVNPRSSRDPYITAHEGIFEPENAASRPLNDWSNESLSRECNANRPPTTR